MDSTELYSADIKNIYRDYLEFLPEYTNCSINILPIPAGEPIRHIVISGGGTMGFSYYGILQESNKMNLWQYANIQTVYGTSVGAILATIICLQYDWDTLDNYLIKRPWEKVFCYDLNSIFSCMQNNGIFNKTITEQIFRPLLLGKDISLSINMIDFFKITKFELHIIVTNVNTFKSVDISYKTHPDWMLIDAIHASCSIPLLFTPVLSDGELYCDGGFCNNSPVNQCIENGANPDEIFGINTVTKNNEEAETSSFSLFDYIIFLLNKILNKLIFQVEYNIRYKFLVPYDQRSLSNISAVAESQSVREELIQYGIQNFREQLDKMK